MSPLLKHKNPGFTIPKEYFASFDEKVIQQIKLQEMASNQSPFTIPSHYFETISEVITKTVYTQNKARQFNPLSKPFTYKYTIGIAASLILFFSVLHFSNTQTQYNQLTIYEYVENGFLEISPIEIEELIPEEYYDQDFLFSNIDTDELLDYLLMYSDYDNILFE